MLTNIEFETIISSIKKDLFNQRMVGFVNKIDLSDKKYQSNGIVRDDIYKGKFLFPMNYFMSFWIDCQSMYFMSTIFFKYKLDGIRVPQFNLITF